MGSIGKRIQNEISQSKPGEMAVRRLVAGKNQSFRGDASGAGLSPKICGRILVVMKQPKDAVFGQRQNPHPGIKCRWQNFLTAIEAAKYEGALRQAGITPRNGIRRYGACGIVGLVCVRQVDDLLGIKLAMLRRNYRAA